jgi:hypothetical protein
MGKKSGSKKKASEARVEEGAGSETTTPPASAAPSGAPERRKVLGGIDLGVGVLVLFGIWVGLPARWWPVDVFGSLLGLALVAAGVGLFLGLPWAKKAAIGVAAAALGVGGILVIALAFTLSHLAGLYGPVGQGGAILLVFVALLLLPYLVFIPAAQLYVLVRETGEKRRT